MLDRITGLLLQICAALAVAALAVYVLRELWLRWRARRLESRVALLRDLLDGGGSEARAYGMLRRRFSILRDVEVLEQLLEERRRLLPEDATPEQVRTLFASYDEAGIVERHVHRLEHSRSWAERAFAARYLGEIGSAGAVEPLIRVMRNTREEDRDVRMAAGRALGRIRDPRALEPLLESLSAPESWLPARIAEVVLEFGDAAFEPLLARLGRHDDPAGRAWAAEILGDLRNPKAVPALITCLNDLSDQVRARAASALGKLQDRRAVPELIRIMLSDPVPYVRIQVVRALGALGDPRALHHLIDALKDGEWWVRIRVVEALEQLGEGAVEPLYLALEDPDTEVRARAAMTLERLGVLDTLIDRLAEVDAGAREKLLVAGQAGVVEVLIEALRHADARVRFVVAEILGEVRNPAVSVALIARLGEESDGRIRAAVVHSLAMLQEATAALPISRLLGDTDERIRVEAVQALERIHVVDPHVLLAAAVRDPEPRVRAGSAVVLGKVGDERAVPALLDLLGDGDAGVRTEAARALGLLRAEAAVSRLVEAFRDFEDSVRVAAARSLGQIGSPECLETLVEGLENASPELGDAVAYALGQIRWQDPERLIDVLFQGADRSSRLGALAALGQMQHAAGHELIRSMLSDSDDEVVCAAVRMLGQLQDRVAIDDLVALLGSPSEPTRLAVLEALCHIRDARGLEAIRKSVFDPSPEVRARAVLALGHLHDLRSGDLLRGILAGESSTPEMRHHAVLSLMVLGREQDLQPILDVLPTLRLFDYLHVRGRLNDALLRETVEAVRASESIEFLVASARSRQEVEDLLAHELVTAHSPERRRRVIETLRCLRSREAYPAVWRAFYKDPSEEVRIAALHFLAEASPPEDFFRLLVDGISDLQPRVRTESMRRLKDLSPERALPLLVPHLESDDAEHQRVLLEYLSALSAANLEAFLDGILGADVGVLGRELVIRVLGRTRHREAASMLESFLEEDEPRLRHAAVEALGRLPSKRAANLLETALQDPDLGVRRSAVDAAAQLGATTALPLLRRALEDPAGELRRRALLQLARLRPREVADDFRNATRDSEPRVRAAALAALVVEGQEPVEEWIGPRDVPAVADALRELDAAENFEKKLSGSRLVQERVGALKALFLRDPRLRASALALARLDPSQRVRAAGMRLEEILEVWLLDPQSAEWLAAPPLPEEPVEEIRAPRLVRIDSNPS